MICDAFYAWVARQVAAVGESWVQLHIGDPGDDGILAGAVDGRRMATTWMADAATLTSTRVLRWDNVQGIPGYPQRVTHLSFWTAPQDGACWFTTPLTAPVNVPHGATLEIPAGIKVPL